jgi:hypothetical protein
MTSVEHINKIDEIKEHDIFGYWKAIEYDAEGIPSIQIIRAYDKSKTYIALLAMMLVDEELNLVKLSFAFSGTWSFKDKTIFTLVNEFKIQDNDTQKYLNDNPDVMANLTEQFSSLLNSEQIHKIIDLTKSTLQTESEGELTILQRQE